MNTVQEEEEEIKYIPEGAKCKLHVGLCIICSQGLKKKISWLIDKFPTYLGFRKLFPLKKT